MKQKTASAAYDRNLIKLEMPTWHKLTEEDFT